MVGKRSLVMMWMLVVLLSVLLLNSAAFAKEKKTNQDKKEKSLSVKKENLLVLTVATDETDGFRRFMRSAKRYKHNVTVLGMGEEWQGGDMSYAGGGHKIVLLKEAMKKYKDIKDLVVMFVDSYDVVITAGAEAILGAFLKFKAGAVFSTEGFCWPDASLAEKYPVVKMNEKRYLNSGGFIGYAPDVFSIVDKFQGNPTDDDQLFYTQVFLDEPFRTKLNIKLDTRGEIFQNLHGALDEVQIKFKGASSYMYNTKSGNTPMVIHGNGPITVEFNNLANYLADQWTPTVGCQVCKEDIISLKKVKHEDYPQVVVAIFIEQPTPFVEDFLQHIGELNYPKKKIDLFIHYADEFHKNDTEKFVSEMKKEYNSITVYGPKDEFSSWTARNRGLDECTKRNCQYYFSLDATAHLEDPLVLQSLIERNRSVIAPLLVRPSKMWSNFWGALSNDGFYKRSDDYLEIVQKSRQGVWVVPYINDAYLIHGNLIKSLKGGYIFEEMDPDMAICRRMREKGIFMYIDNMDYYGHLVDFEQFETSHWRNDLFNIFVNKYTWEKKYLHVDYNTSLDKNSSLLQPCPDVYWFPIVTRKFCRHLVEELEHYGQWSGGRNEDPRLAGGYENVPTVDIHMSQLGFEKQWLRLLKDYIVPLQIRAFPGYYSEGRSVMNFAVRYHPQEQDHLRPHHDSSTFTINIALNRAHIDYEGGGCHFIRYNCSVQDTKMGWMLMHPGRLTHYHEGLRVTKGVRYIMISFVDP